MKVLTLLSGGLDSTVLLHKMKSYNDEVKALTLNYGQLHSKEIECAQWQAESLHVEWSVLDISDAFRNIQTPLLGEGFIPHASYADQLRAQGEGKVRTYVPNRNMILLSIAGAQAMQMDCKIVAYAAHMDDAAGSAYPDCTPEFVHAMDNVLRTQGLRLFAPFITGHDGAGWNKADIVRKGIELGVDFSHTWSCYEGHDKPCGGCGTCLDRIEAFRLNNAKDPLIYE